MTLLAVPPPTRRTYATETQLQRACQERIALHGGLARKLHGSVFSVKGDPDLYGVVYGRMVVFECKQPGESPSPLQLKRLRDWQKAGALAGWGRSELELEQLLAHAGDPAWTNPQLQR